MELHFRGAVTGITETSAQLPEPSVPHRDVLPELAEETQSN
jgi:hypothetical protein